MGEKNQMKINTQDALPSITHHLCLWVIFATWLLGSYEFCFKTALHELELSAGMEVSDGGKSINRLQSYRSENCSEHLLLYPNMHYCSAAEETCMGVLSTRKWSLGKSKKLSFHLHSFEYIAHDDCIQLLYLVSFYITSLRNILETS